jgi:hypothetical protein
MPLGARRRLNMRLNQPSPCRKNSLICTATLSSGLLWTGRIVVAYSDGGVSLRRLSAADTRWGSRMRASGSLKSDRKLKVLLLVTDLEQG